MIYLITGSPGTGKTAFALSMIRTNDDKLFTFDVYEKDEKGRLVKDENGKHVFIDTVKRPIFVNHIDDIDHDFFNTQDISDEDIISGAIDKVLPVPTPDDPYVIPPVLIVDEAHRLYKNRSSTSSIPDFVESLAELRHHGITLILMTQHPSSIDKYVRDRVGKHYHLGRAKVGSKKFTFYECCNSLSRSDLVGAMPEFYKPDPKVFEHYQSASNHIKFKKKTIKALYIFPILVILLIGAFVFLGANFGNITNFSGVNKVDETASESNQFGLDSVASGTLIPSDKVVNDPAKDDTQEYLEQFVPRVNDMPESKPMYDKLRVVKSFEYPAALIKVNGKCKAYSQQGTLMNDIPESFCNKWLKEGRFNPYVESINPAPKSSSTEAATEKADILNVS